MKNELLELLENQEFNNKAVPIEMRETLFITQKEPVYTLKECLESAEEEVLRLIYLGYTLTMNKRKIDLEPPYEKLIKDLEKSLPKAFSDYLSGIKSEERKYLKENIENDNITTSNFSLLCSGFMYGFVKNKKNVYVIPQEFIKIYKDYMNSPESKKLDYEVAEYYIMGMLFIKGILETKYIEDVIINDYLLNVTKKDIDEIIQKKYSYYKNKKYVILRNELSESEMLLEALLKHNDKDVIKLDEDLVNDYITSIKSFLFELSKILKRHKGLAEKLFFAHIILGKNIEEFLINFKVTKNEKDKTIELFNEYNLTFRYWAFGGKNIDEMEKEYCMKNPHFKEKPKSTDINSCLKTLPKEVYDRINLRYILEDGETLVDAILEYAKEKTENHGDIYLKAIINTNGNEINSFIQGSFLMSGLCFLYLENDKIKCLIPDEILEIFNGRCKQFEKEDMLDDLIACYVSINGIIEKEKLQELLNKYEDIDISIKELDSIAKDMDIYIVNNKYYTWIEGLELEEFKQVLEMKKRFGKYKRANLENDKYEIEFREKLTEILDDEEYTFFIIFIIKSAMFNEDALEFILNDLKISSKEIKKKRIIELYKEYKRYVSIWAYNGYTALEYNSSINQTGNKKVGRNEPCPCGSSKKYKKCCGK